MIIQTCTYSEYMSINAFVQKIKQQIVWLHTDHQGTKTHFSEADFKRKVENCWVFWKQSRKQRCSEKFLEVVLHYILLKLGENVHIREWWVNNKDNEECISIPVNTATTTTNNNNSCNITEAEWECAFFPCFWIEMLSFHNW